MDHTFTSALAHDLKNRLAVLAQELLSIEPENLRPSDQEHLLNARAQAEDSLRALTHFLVLTKANAGALRCNSQQEPLADLVGEVLDRARVFSQAGPVPQLDMEGAPESWFFDRNLLALALDAGLDNAARHADKHVLLRVRAEQGGVRFLIENDIVDSRKDVRAPHATGLGLSIIQAVAVLHRNKGRTGTANLRVAPGRASLDIWLP